MTDLFIDYTYLVACEKDKEILALRNELEELKIQLTENKHKNPEQDKVSCQRELKLILAELRETMTNIMKRYDIQRPELERQELERQELEEECYNFDLYHRDVTYHRGAGIYSCGKYDIAEYEKICSRIANYEVSR